MVWASHSLRSLQTGIFKVRLRRLPSDHREVEHSAVVVLARHDPPGVASYQASLRYVLGEDGAGRDRDAITNRYRAGDHGSRPDPDVVTNLWDPLIAAGDALADCDVLVYHTVLPDHRRAYENAVAMHEQQARPDTGVMADLRMIDVG